MPTKVIVLGGGVAGMSAAHELIERGFEVVVLERGRLAGGKARSIPVIDDGAGTSGHERADLGVASIEHHLPGEHGFRFFPGFYKHVIDTMRRIPSFDGRTAADHLVPTTRVGFTQYGKPTFLIPSRFPRTGSDVGALLRDVLLAFGPVIGLAPDELAFFAARFWQILTSCDERRIGEYEQIDWWEFIGAEHTLGVLSEIPRHRLYAVARCRQGAQGQRPYRRRHVHADDDHVYRSDRRVDGPPPGWADQSRLDRPVAQLSRSARRAVSVRSRRSRRFCATAGRSPASRCAGRANALWCRATITSPRYRLSAWLR